MAQLREDKPVVVTARRAQTRERLMAAAMHVFAERGVNGASVEEICEAAGFTRGAFYSNFADKSALVLAIIEQDVANHVVIAEHAIAAIRAQPDASSEEIVSLALTAFEGLGRTPEESILANRELLLHAAREPALREPYLRFLEESQRQIAVLIRDALSQVGLEFTIPVEQAIVVLGAVHERAQLMAVFQQRPTDQDALRSLLTAVTKPA